MTSCSSCGLQIGHDARFCPHCGASQALAVEERRIVTVLFADIAGFTALAEQRDPEEVKHLVDRAFERLARDITAFGGVIDKVLGDGIIALFGAPIAHEDDAERAVRAGLRMQQTMTALSEELYPPIAVRIGINTGEVLVGGSAAGGDYTAMGDVVNSADRLQNLARPGQTLVGAPTKHATGDAIAYDFIGELPARGRERPLEAWLALEPVRPPGQHQQRVATFVGRHNEMALLRAQARLAFDGHRAQLAMLVGEAGIGKTRLAHEAAAAIAEDGEARVLEGRCLPYGEANVWWAVADLIRDLYDLRQDGPVEETELVVRKALRAQLEPADDEQIDRLTTSLLHTLGYDTPLRGGDRSHNRSEVTLAVTTVLEAELERRPMVLLLSDMHWATSPVWVLCRHLLTDLARERLVVIMTTRSDDEEHLHHGRHGLAVIQLGPLDPAASASLLADLGADLGDHQVEDLVTRSGGNPFFLEELAGLMSPQSPRGAADEFDVEIDQLPATLRGIISARLDALDLDERALLEDASVLGRTGSLDGLFTLARETREATDADRALQGLVDADLLEVDGRRFRFRSNLVRDVAYGRLTKTTRAQQHYGIANYLENTQGEAIRNSVVVAIAEHYRAAAQLSDELSALAGLDRQLLLDRATYWLEQAGDRALEVGEPVEAARWYDHGVVLSNDDETLARFLFGRARARTEVHDIVGARADLDRLDAMAGLAPHLAARALLVRGDVDRKAGDLAQAAERLQEAALRLEKLGDTTEQALALRLLGMTEMMRSDDGRSRAALEESRRVAVEAGDRRSEGWALQSLAWHGFRSGRIAEARQMVGQALTIFDEIEDYGAQIWTQGVMAWVAFHSGDWDHARELINRVLPETTRRGDPQAQCLMLYLDATLHLWSGRAEAAADRAREATSLAETVEDVTVAVMAKAVEGRALVSLGRIDEGTSLLEDTFSLADQVDDPESRRIAVVANCASAARLGEPDRAIRWAARYDTEGNHPEIVGETDLLVSLGLAMLQRGAVEEAAAQLDGEELGESSFVAAVGALVAAAQGDLERSADLAAAVFATRATYLDRVLAHLALAAVRVRVDDGVGAVAALGEARSELEPTDDQVTRRLVDLAAGAFGLASLPDAESRMRRAGLDPVGWSTAFALAASTQPITADP